MIERLRLATFNVENLDDTPGEGGPDFGTRMALIRPALLRLDADVLCLQEVHGQQEPGAPRSLRALARLLHGTDYANFHQAVTTTADGAPFRYRNLVVLSRFPITKVAQYRHDLGVAAPVYRLLTATEGEPEPRTISWERPLLHVVIELPTGQPLHVINLHLKSRNPTPIPGQQIDRYTWRTAAGWAEGSFVSAIKRLGQALETRVLVDSVFDEEPDALIAVCGDLNATEDEVPVTALRGDVEDTGNGALAGRVLVGCERSVAEPARFTLYHHGRGEMFDHILASRALLAGYRGTEIHNELLHDESVAFAGDVAFPEPDHAPVVAEFRLRAA